MPRRLPLKYDTQKALGGPAECRWTLYIMHVTSRLGAAGLDLVLHRSMSILSAVLPHAKEVLRKRG